MDTVIGAGLGTSGSGLDVDDGSAAAKLLGSSVRGIVDISTGQIQNVIHLGNMSFCLSARKNCGFCFVHEGFHLLFCFKFFFFHEIIKAMRRWIDLQDADLRENPHGENHHPRGRPPLCPAEIGHSFLILLVALIMLLLLGNNNFQVLVQLVLPFHVIAPVHHLLRPLLENNNHKNKQICRLKQYDPKCTCDSTSRISSPADGRSFQPMICTGIVGPASFRDWLFSSNMKRTFAQVVPATSMQPFFRVPRWMMAVVTGLRKQSPAHTLYPRRGRRSLPAGAIILHCLLHHTIISCYHQDDDICDQSSSCSHCSECCMTRLMDMVSTPKRSDVLCDAASLLCHNLTLPQTVQKCGLSMVNMTHNGHHWSPGYLEDFLDPLHLHHRVRLQFLQYFQIQSSYQQHLIDGSDGVNLPLLSLQLKRYLVRLKLRPLVV
ncbi:hypothetical protein DNTS_026107 [Danionella cerebrum]|uniref:Uncharacterized protein n=1 Tax=Danionella cerebrum TaxID=2873325 RepID=A0A553RLV8_9TELE|nr:hypothetical protein DNTS_026107 [Danionella translucida]